MDHRSSQLQRRTLASLRVRKASTEGKAGTAVESGKPACSIARSIP